jgi:hypothetical protein
VTSALLPKADISRALGDVRFVPIADMPAYFDSGLTYWPTLPLDLALVHLLGLRRKAIERT